MLRRSFTPLWLRISAVSLQGWGASSGGGGGGWGTSDAGGGGGWGSAADSKATSGGSGGWGSSSGQSGGGGGWGTMDSAATPSSGGWGTTQDGAAGGWGSAAADGGWGSGGGGGGGAEREKGGGRYGRSRDNGQGGGSRGSRERRSGGGGGWGDSQENGGGFKSGWGAEGGWREASGSGRQRGGRGNFRRGRQGGNDGGGVWGRAATVDEEAWSAAPPSFQPPVRRVDPLSLTAVEVEVDGVKKLVGQRVLVSGLSDETTWHTLKDHLRQAGDLTFCRIFSGGRGMVEFATPEEAARCITELQASELEGATLYLREDREDTVLMNTRRKIRDAREAQLRARKAEAEKARRAKAVEQGDVPDTEAPASTTA